MPSYPSSSVAPSNGGYSTGSPSHVTVYKSSVPLTHPTSTKVSRMDSAEFPGEESPSSVFPYQPATCPSTNPAWPLVGFKITQAHPWWQRGRIKAKDRLLQIGPSD